MAAAFDVVAWEIELAGARCIQLDTIIGELLPSMPIEQRERLLEGLHTVDLLSQHLTGLSAFMRTVSEDASEEVSTPVSRALADVTLGALANRLFTAFGGEEEVVRDLPDAGDVDLF
ncbi:MAG TPA: hypothetical protein VHY32_02485 [Caulobacteraceae bacterium]|nr:hypothetical protein [Caulobacteraceae bacterium]